MACQSILRIMPMAFSKYWAIAFRAFRFGKLSDRHARLPTDHAYGIL